MFLFFSSFLQPQQNVGHGWLYTCYLLNTNKNNIKEKSIETEAINALQLIIAGLGKHTKGYLRNIDTPDYDTRSFVVKDCGVFP